MLGANPTDAQEPKTSPKDKTNTPVNETLRTIQSLRTTHGNFQDKPIPDPEIQTILQAGIRAANSSNMQTYSVIVVKDRKVMGDVCGYQGSCLLLFCVDYNRIKATAEFLGHTYIPDNIVNFVTASINTALAAQTSAIAAKSMGIDYLLTNGIHRGDMDRVWRILDLPQKYCFPLIALVLGYPTEESTQLKGRLDGVGVFHWDKYHLPNKEEQAEITRKYDDKNLHLGLNDTWVADGEKHYLDWLHKKWLAGSNKPTDKETQMLELLKRSGFVESNKT